MVMDYPEMPRTMITLAVLEIAPDDAELFIIEETSGKIRTVIVYDEKEPVEEILKNPSENGV